MRYREGADDTEDSDAVLDMSIAGDEEEQHRIELEHNLQDLSIQLSLSNPSHASDQENSMEQRGARQKQSESSYELEYPRHNSRHREVSIFHGQESFLDNPRFERDMDPNFHSYHSVEDDADVHYVGNTMSTPAHHASAVTLSAGLGGRGGKRAYAAESSLSGAEYDPDRPLDTVLNGVADDLSLLNVDNTPLRGKRVPRNAPPIQAQVTFDPVIVDYDSFAIGGANHSFNKLRNTRQAQEHATSFHSDREATPKSKTRSKRAAFKVQPPTPPSKANATANSSATQGSKFTRLAKSLAREIEASQRWADAAEFENESPVKPSRKKQSAHRSPFRDVVNHVPTARNSGIPSNNNPRISRPATKTKDAYYDILSKQDHSQSKIVCLPDVTGLTSAVASPPRKDQKRRTYSGGSEGERVQNELLKALTMLQTRLNQLESQNLVSRRRIQELERELEVCKLEVKRERTRVMERDEIIIAQQRDFQKRRNDLAEAAQKIPNVADAERYKEVVEEKKALESLVATLRSHLARLTTELSNQKSQLDELRTMREEDFQGLRDKIAEVDALRTEIERLGSEVEVLRGVVEEGLNQRRKAKEFIDVANSSTSSAVRLPHAMEDVSLAGQNRYGNEDSRAEFPSPPPSRPSSRQQDRPRPTNKPAPSANETERPTRRRSDQGRHKEKDALRRVSTRVEECPSDGSESHISQDLDASKLENPHEGMRHTRSSRMRVTKDDDRRRIRKTHPDLTVSSRSAKVQTETEIAFPQIRGERLERMFFSAPAHNERTCRVCHRHRRPGATEDEFDFPSWLPPRKRVKLGEDDDRSRYRGVEPDDIEASEVEAAVRRYAKAPFSEDRLPPQTVLVRVLRELEDDFTHYKGIYIELADQYKLIDAASNIAKRNVLAEHLREVIDTLEQKGDQIASLYDLLTFSDKPVKESAVPERRRTSRGGLRSPRPFRQFGKNSESLRKRPTYA